MAERIDIQINDKVNPNVRKKIEGIAIAAGQAHRGLDRLKRELSSLDVTALQKLTREATRLNNSLANLTKANARMMIVSRKSAIEDQKLALSKQRVATETERTTAATRRAASITQAANDKTAQSNAKVALTEQKVATETKRTVQAQARAKTSQQKLTNERQRGVLIANQVTLGQARFKGVLIDNIRKMRNASKAAAQLSKAQGKLSTNTRKSSKSFRGLATAIGSVVGIAFASRAIIDFADSFTLIQNRIKVVTDGTGELADVTEKVFDIAKRTRLGVLDTARAFQRFDRALSKLGRTQEESLRLTETINKSLVISGATVGETSAGLLQLSQAFNKGKLDGDEFRTVMELMPTVADAIATEMGVLTGELLKLAPQGKITSKILADALDRVKKKVDKDFAQLAPTIGQGFTNMKTAAVEALGEIEQKTGILAGLAKTVVFIADHFKKFAVAAFAAGGALTVHFASGLLKAGLALKTFSLAVLLNPMGLLVAAVAATAAVFVLFSSKTKKATEDLRNFKNVAEKTAQTVDALADAENDILVARELGRKSDEVAALKAKDAAIVGLIKTLTKAERLDVKKDGLINRMFFGGDEEINKLKKDFKTLGIDLSKFIEETTKEVTKPSVYGDVTVIETMYGISPEKLKLVKALLIAQLDEINTKVLTANKELRTELERESDKINSAVSASLSGGDTSGLGLSDEQKKDVKERVAKLKELTSAYEEQMAALDDLNLSQKSKAELQKLLNKLAKEGKEVSQAEKDALIDSVKSNERVRDVKKELNSIIDENQGKLDELAVKMQALTIAEFNGSISSEQYANSMVKLNNELLRTQLLMGDGSFNSAIEVGLGQVVGNYENALTSLSNSFGNFFEGVSDGFADSIGRAIVMGEDLEASLKSVAQNALAELISSFVKLGIQYAVNAVLSKTAMASVTVASAGMAKATALAWAPAMAATTLSSFGANILPASAAMGTANALAAAFALKPFKEGGYTGNVGTSEVAGVVHGREFVMNADATARNRPMLEAMNQGRSSSVGGTMVNVTVENYGNSEISVEQVSPGDVRIIARDVAKQAIREDAPGVIANDISNPNSRVSKSIGSNTNATRKR